MRDLVRSLFERVQRSAALWAALSCGLMAIGCEAERPVATPASSAEATAPSSAVEEEARAEAEAAIRALLDGQVAAWNAGDIETFMAGYWDSPELRFASGNSVRRGWQETIERYRTTYPDRAAMGQLTFDGLEIEVAAADWATVFGRWRLEREEGEPNGLFTLHLRRQPEGHWLIVADHTSSAPTG